MALNDEGSGLAVTSDPGEKVIKILLPLHRIFPNDFIVFPTVSAFECIFVFYISLGNLECK